MPSPCFPRNAAMAALQSLMQSPSLQPRRLGWEGPDLMIERQGEVALFVGCLPHMEVLLGHQTNTSFLDIARSGVGLLNALGLRPVLMRDERCCGRDLLAAGDRKGYLRLLDLNLQALQQAGVQKVLTLCPECAQALGPLARAEGRDHGLIVMPLVAHLASRASDLALTAPPNTPVVLLDPFHEDHGGAALLRAAGVRLVEASPQATATDRLREARRQGAQMMVTSCPRCLHHLRYAQRPGGWQQVRVNMADLTCFLSSMRESK